MPACSSDNVTSFLFFVAIDHYARFSSKTSPCVKKKKMFGVKRTCEAEKVETNKRSRVDSDVDLSDI